MHGLDNVASADKFPIHVELWNGLWSRPTESQRSWTRKRKKESLQKSMSIIHCTYASTIHSTPTHYTLDAHTHARTHAPAID